MSKLSRIFQKQFGVNAGASDVGIFGSLAASDPQYSKDPTEIQSLNAFLTGWAAETIANNRPALEDFNALDFLTFYQLCYLFQSGVPEWDDETTYYTGSIVQDGNGVLYRSLDDDNVNNELTDTDYWAPIVSETAGGVLGSFKNLKAVRASVTQVTVTADELILEDSDGNKVSVRNFNQSASITSSGAGGLDSGSESNGAYYIWAIRKSSDGTEALLISASSTSPTMPAGYDQKCLVSGVFNMNGDFVDFKQYGLDYVYTLERAMASGAVGYGAWTTIDASNYVLSGLSEIIRIHIRGQDPSDHQIWVTNDSSQTIGPGPNVAQGGHAPSGPEISPQYEFNFLSAQNLYWATLGASTTGVVYCRGFKITKL